MAHTNGWGMELQSAPWRTWVGDARGLLHTSNRFVEYFIRWCIEKNKLCTYMRLENTLTDCSFTFVQWHIEKSNVKLSHLHVGLYTMDASIVLQNARQVSALVYSLFNVHHGIDPGIRFDELLSNAYLSTVIPHVEGLEHGVHLTHLTRSHLQKAHNKIQNYNSFIRCFCDLHCLFHLLQARMLRFWKRKGTKTFSSCTQWGNC